MTTLTKKSAQKKLQDLQTKKKKLLIAEQQLQKLKEEEKKLTTIIENADKPKDITETVTSFELACKYEKKDPKKVLPYPKPQTDDERYLNAIAMMNIITRIWRQNWVPDYGNSNQRKWFPWFEWKPASSGRPAGFVFSYSVFDYVTTYTDLGSRFAFESEQKAIRAGQLFIKIYNVILTLGTKNKK